MPDWLMWLLFLPAVVIASYVSFAAFRLLMWFFEGVMYLTYRLLNAGSAEHEAIMKGYPSRAHLAGRHRPLRRWAPRCQHCFEQHQNQLREERRQARKDST